MIVKKYDAKISKELPIDVKIKKDAVLNNYYPYYVIGKSTKIAKEIWNNKNLSMNYNVVWESEDMICGYPQNVDVGFRIYRDGNYVAGCHVRYDCTNGEILAFNVKCEETESVKEGDIKDFIQNVIRLWGELAYNELEKVYSQDSNSQNNDAFSPRTQDDLNDETNNLISNEKQLDEDVSNYGTESDNEGLSTKQTSVTPKYTKSSWQKHGYYKKTRMYIKSCICHRDAELLK